jgi:hypothetical protein
MSFCVLNASFPVNVNKELDDYVDYRQGLESCFSGDKIIKKCISWHSLPAAHSSEFFVYKKQGWEGCFKYDNILVLVREDLNHVEPLIKKLKLMKKKVGIGFHENGQHMLQFTQDLNWFKSFKSLLDKCDYYWNANYSLSDVISATSNIRLFTSSHAVPHDFCEQFSVPKDKRDGIMIGTRTFSQWINRNTLAALSSAVLLSRKYNQRITFVSGDGIEPSILDSYFKEVGFSNVTVLAGGMNYEEWLKTIARHKCMLHADQSETLGQVAADACSVGVPCYGGSAYNNVIASTDATLANTRAKLEEDLKTDFKDCLFNFELLKFETSYETIRKRHEQFFKQL